MDIRQLAETRARLLGRVIALEQDATPPSSDREERLTHAVALNRAQRAYQLAEEEYQRATATLSEDELAALLRRKEQAA